MSKFVHLHLHTEYSLLDGACRIKDLVKKAKELDMPAIAITDHGNMHGYVDFYRACYEEGIKPIIGCEVYVAPGSRFEKKARAKDDTNDAYGGPAHLVLLAENNKGYQNLIKLCSLGYTEGFYYKPRIDHELLEKYSEGLIALSACLGGEIPRLIMLNRYNEAVDLALWYQKIFGDKNYYLEIQDHGIPKQDMVNKAIFKISKETGVPLVATNDTHYIEKEDSFFHDLLLCIQTKRSIFEPSRDENPGGRMKFPSDEFWFKDYADMAVLFPDHLNALDNTIKIAERCNVDIQFGRHQLPDFPCPAGFNEKSYLRHLVDEGLQRRYSEISTEVLDRVKLEFSVIEEKGFSGYFLIVWDFISWAKKNGIRVGPGRGSVAGSIIAYALGIMEIDPLKYNTLFERFLDFNRPDPPDIDIDFLDTRRDEVIEYVRQKYGQDCVTQIATFGTFGARGSVKDVARYLLPKEEKMNLVMGDRIAELIPENPKITLEKALEDNTDLKNLYNSDAQVRKIYDLARKIEGLARHSSVHAAAVVIAPRDITNYVPILMKNGIIATQLSWTRVESLGLLKMDFLGLRTLTIISDTLENIRMDSGEEIDIDNITLDDKKTYKMLGEGDTSGVFQLESEGMRNVLTQLKPSRLEDIIAINALYRPGPMNSIPDYIKNAHLGKVKYLLDPLGKHLGETYGVIVYQEQVMNIVQDIAGFTRMEANYLRKALSKKKMKEVLSYRQKFIEGGKEASYEQDKLELLWDQMASFGEYGFNKSHSSAYGILAYQTAYLKANYPLHFMAAEITNVMHDTSKVAYYLHEAERMNIEVMPPDINYSTYAFRVFDNKLTFGLLAIKNVGKGAIEAIIAARDREGEFKSLYDFCYRVDLGKVNKRAMESLIQAGAMKSLRLKRSQLMAVLEECINKASREYEKQQNGQVSLFDVFDQNNSKIIISIPDINEFPAKRLLEMEKELTGLYLTGHPLDQYKKAFKSIITHYCTELNKTLDKVSVTLGGMIKSLRTITTKKGDLMCFLALEDTTGIIDVTVFPRTYEQYRSLLNEDKIIIMYGTVNYRNDRVGVILERCAPIASDIESLHIELVSEPKETHLKEIIYIVKEYPGYIPLYLHIDNQSILAGNHLHVSIDDELIDRLNTIDAVKNVIRGETKAGRNYNGD